jgi:autotransporter translocation and assembly factor TamB
MDYPKRIRKLPYFLAFLALIGILIFVLRGPHISNALKKIILPELEMASGENIIARKISVNIFPLFIETKDLKVFDEEGERIIIAKRAKAYIELSGLLKRNIVIRRLVIKEPIVTANREQINEIIENIKANVSRKKEGSLKVIVKAVEIKNGSAHFNDAKTESISDINDLNAELIIGKTKRIKASAEKIKVSKKGLSEITGDADISLTLKKESVQINSITIETSGSKVTGSGQYHRGRLKLKTDLDLKVLTVKDIFNLNNSGDGKIEANGNIEYADNKISVDLKLAGNFYLQTLMELLEVEDRIEGLVNVEGQIEGPLSDLRGIGTTSMHQGNLYDVDIDFVKCKVSYQDGTMRFFDGDGKLYNGYAKASATIQLPVVDFFTLDIDFSDIDSNEAFRLIGWDLGFHTGKVKGRVSSAGAVFNPKGWFEYKHTGQALDVLDRVRDISGEYELQGSLLSLIDLKISTGMSSLYSNGFVDVEQETLNIDGILETNDITDISSPYYERLKGNGMFEAKIKGTFDDPVISGNIKLFNTSIEGYDSGILEADVTYKKDLLNIRELVIKQDDELHSLNGRIYFEQAKELFYFSDPEFKLNASLNNADLEKFIKIFYPDFVGFGRLQSALKIAGSADRPVVTGEAVVEKAAIYKVAFDSAAFKFKYDDKKLEITKTKVKRGKSIVKADASIDTSGKFFFKANTDKIVLSDLMQRDLQGDVIFSVNAQGHGTLDNPSILFDANIIKGVLKGRSVGSGDITASIENKDFSLSASLINDKINITAKGRLESDIPWDAKVDIQSGRYDSLIASFLKDVPEDLILSLDGSVFLRGNKEHISGSSVLKNIVLSMYGYSFTNEEEIKVDINDKQLDLNKISLRSGNTSLSIYGRVEIGNQYNIVLEGSSALAPFKSLSDKIAVLKGDTEFVISITGRWDLPRINGGLSLSNASVGIKNYYHRVSALNGYFYIDEDRIILKELSGKVGGGEIEISGVLYLKKFSFKRFYLEAVLTDITTSLSNDISVNFGGNLLYKGTPASQMISGNIELHRARYKKRVEWKSWLLQTKKAEKLRTEISNFEKAELNIRVEGKDNIIIDNNLARSTASADIVLRGSIYRPILFGRLKSNDGTVYFRNNEFRIIHASVDFSDPNRINPFMEINSETVVKGYKVKMNLEGQADHFNLSLSSDPPLKEMDILTLLTVGKMGGELKGLEGGIGASEATSFMTGKFQDVLEERLTTITGLDRLQIDPYVSKTTANVEPRVTVSKRLIGEKMFVTYTTTLATKEEQILKLEYYLNKNMSLLGVRDERGIFGGDISFRFTFK